jgi:hypothetical protein
MRALFTILAGIGLACALAVTATATSPRRAVFQVTLNATVTKEWNTVTRRTQNGCTTATRSRGVDTVKLRSSRPSRVIVTFRPGRVEYTSGAVRPLTLTVDQQGVKTVTIEAPCRQQTVYTRCLRKQQTLDGGTARFFRSGKNELSFGRSSLPVSASSCPGQSADVQAIRPGLHEAQGEISEARLANPRITQTALGSSVQTTDLEGDETGRVIERVRWALTFTRSLSTRAPQT